MKNIRRFLERRHAEKARLLVLSRLGKTSLDVTEPTPLRANLESIFLTGVTAFFCHTKRTFMRHLRFQSGANDCKAFQGLRSLCLRKSSERHGCFLHSQSSFLQKESTTSSSFSIPHHQDNWTDSTITMLGFTHW